jgi:hypothetical protein
MISEDRMTKALTYLAETDEDCAELKANVARTEYIAKLREATAFKIAEGNVESRKADAKLSREAQEAWDLHFIAMTDYERVRAKRETQSIIIDTWRSLNANRRQAT